MRIDEVMTPDPACCSATDKAQTAAMVMLELNVGIVPVVGDEESKKLVGLVTDRDLCMDIVAMGLDPRTVNLQDCMTIDLVTCRPNDDVESVLRLMQANQVRRVPVVDANGVIQGIVSLADMVLCGDLPATDIDATMQDISEPTLEEFEALTALAPLSTAAAEQSSAPEGSI